MSKDVNKAIRETLETIQLQLPDGSVFSTSDRRAAVRRMEECENDLLREFLHMAREANEAEL